MTRLAEHAWSGGLASGCDRSHVTVASWPSPVTDPRRSITSDDRTLLVVEGPPDHPGDRKLTWQFTVPDSRAGSIPWHVLQGNMVAYAWREEVPGQAYQYHDLVRAIDMTSGNVL